MTFSLHQQLEQDSEWVVDLTLSQVRLINDATYPWCILVPQVADITECTDLSEAQYQVVMQESRALSIAMQTLFTPTKMNIASIGNRVPQLHIHHIARYQNDPSWPKPIWGQLPMQPYQPSAIIDRIEHLRSALG